MQRSLGWMGTQSVLRSAKVLAGGVLIPRQSR
jgi:hypothetical protein